MRWLDRFIPGGGTAALLLASMAASAGPSTALESQVRAQAVLNAAIQAIGGEAALRELRTVRREFVEDWVDVGQGHRPWTGTPPADALPPHAGFDDSESLSFADYAGRRSYEWVRYADFPNDQAVIADVVTPERAFQSITYMRERPLFTAHPSAGLERQWAERRRRHPEGALRAALDRVETLVWLGHAEEAGESLDVIAFADTDGAQVRLCVDAASGRLARIEAVRGHRVYGDTTRDTVYSDFRRVGRLTLPYAFTDRIAGVPVSRNIIRSMDLDVPARDDWFAPPADSVATVASPDTPSVEPVGGGVYVIRGLYNLTFAEFRDHVLLIEAPVGEPYMNQVLALIQATVPGKPVRVVATHFHFDHIGGVRTAVARGMPILTTGDARGVIERSLASHQGMRPDELARNPREPRIEISGPKTVLDDGTQRVELFDFGPMPHVAHILVAYFPRQKLLHVADMLDVLTPELVIAGVDTAVMAEHLRELGLDVRNIVPMHGVPITIEQLRRGLEIRRKYQEAGE